MYIAVAFEVEADEPVADLVYRGREWASITQVGDERVLTTYGPVDVPLTPAVAALDEARRRLEALR